ncbi:MAG: hypothetical protein U0K35_11195 [Prevotella sp.]|nr:hypothetical protein [Prevotella sp.]
MKKNTDYSNLKSKTIFDFCDDEQMLDDLAILSKESYLEIVKEYPLYNAHTLIEYAELTNNNELLAEVHLQYKDELEAENNE